MTNLPFLKNSYSYEDIYYAYLDCRKSKRNSISAINFEINYEENLKILLDEINNGTYKIGRSTVFAVTQPKPREVWAADFRDRIVHHLVIGDIQEYFEKRFIYDSYSCIKNKGTLKCIQKAYKSCRKITQNWQNDACYIKLDLKNFFGTIDKHILWNIMKEKIGDESLTSRLIKQIIFNPMQINPIIINKNLNQVPVHKSLLHQNNYDIGLPIGNLSSQFFSNVYLDGLDQYCKHVLKLKYYFRYADDILILTNDLSKSNEIIKNIKVWLKNHRNQELNDNKTIKNHIKYGIHYLGSIIYPYHIISNNRLKYNLKKSIKKLNKNKFSENSIRSVNSYIGLLNQYDSYKFITECLKKISNILFHINNRRIRFSKYF